MTVLRVIIGRCSIDDQYAGTSSLLTKIGSSNFRYKDKDHKNNSSDRSLKNNDSKKTAK